MNITESQVRIWFEYNHVHHKTYIQIKYFTCGFQFQNCDARVSCLSDGF